MVLVILYSIAFLVLLICPSISPANAIITRLFAGSILLLLINPKNQGKPTLIHWLFLAFLAWTAICCLYSEYPSMAFQGFYKRSEGLLTWLVLTGFAIIYWQSFRGLNEMRLILKASAVIILGIAIFMDREVFKYLIMPEVALGAFASLSCVFLWAITPAFALFSLPLLIYANNRASVIGAISGILFCEILKNPQRLKKGLKFAIPILLVFGIFSAKFRHIDPSNMGNGSRTQWLLQGYKMAKELPLTGLGLDTLSEYLKPATGKTVHAKAVPDKTHNIAMDLILQTGWIGYTLALLILGAALGLTIKFPTQQNLACFAVLIAWVVIGCINPIGVPGHAIMLIGLFGIKKS